MVTPSLLWALRNREPIDPAEARVFRHLGFWTMFFYVQWKAYDRVAPELMFGAVAGAIIAALVPALRSRISFVAISGAMLATMIVASIRSGAATPIVETIVLGVLVVVALIAPARGLYAALLLLLALLMFLDPWFALSPQTAAHFAAAMMAMVMLSSMILLPPGEGARRADEGRGVTDMPGPSPGAARHPLPAGEGLPAAPPMSAAEYDRAHR